MSGKGILSAAIDFGTTFSTWAFSFKHNFEQDPTNIKAQRWTCHGSRLSEKAPTCILLKPDGRFDSFGYEAERKYATLVLDMHHQEWYFFQRFKMQLFSKHIGRNLELEDVSGKKMKALKIFSLAIKFLKTNLLVTLGRDTQEGKSHKNETDSEGKPESDDMKPVESDIQWVLTVPAIWDDAAKQFMREAAQNAGIPSEKLFICLEPEAASIYCRCLPSSEIKGSFSGLEKGTKYMIVDAGGGTVDITVHEIGEHGQLLEKHRASGGDWGGTRVDKEFFKFLEKVFGKGVLEVLMEEHMEDYLDLCANFEMKKRITPADLNNMVTITLPSAVGEVIEAKYGTTIKEAIQKSPYNDKLILKGNKLRIGYDVFKDFFHYAISETVKKVSQVLSHRDVKGCAKILMVGGFSNSLLLQESMREKFPKHEVVIPLDAELSIIKGAVIFGHDPNFIAERKLKYTYGTNVAHPKTRRCNHTPGEIRMIQGIVHCVDLFSVHVRAGQVIKIGEEQDEQLYSPSHPLVREIEVTIYSSTETNPTFVTDDSCQRIGSLKIPLTTNLLAVLNGNPFGVTFMFGGTEIKVKGVDKFTGTKTEVYLDYLDQ